MTEKLSVQRLDTLRGDLLRKNNQGIGWRDLAENYPGVPPGTLCAFAHGREPKKPSVRAALGLPVLAPAPVCPDCQVPHVTQRCPKKRKASRPGLKPRQKKALKLLGVLWGG
jgi:hypothetical protein